MVNPQLNKSAWDSAGLSLALGPGGDTRHSRPEREKKKVDKHEGVCPFLLKQVSMLWGTERASSRAATKQRHQDWLV